METLLKDVRYSVRMLVRNPAFTLVSVLALALGIGANVAIFSVVNGVLLRPLPFKEPDRLMMIRETKLPVFPEFSVAPGNFLDWKKQNTVFEHLAAFQGTSFNLIGSGEPERLRGMFVTEGFFSMLGAQPQLGRDFLPEEDQPGHNKVAILSHGLWQRRFGGDPKVLNQPITLSGESYTVIGVMPASFRIEGRDLDLWTPMALTAAQATQHGGHYIVAVGRLKPGVTVDQAGSEMRTIAERLAQQYPDSNTGWSVTVVPLLEYSVKSIKPALLLLLVAVAFVLLIACANVANLLLARAVGRQKEMATRTALGASRWRIVRQLLTESLLLSSMGGALGLLLAKWGMDLLLTLAPPELPRISSVSIDGRALAFTVALTFLTGIIFGLVPALQASRPNLNETLKDAGRGSTEGSRRQLIRHTLVVMEVAAALVLLVGAGLMIKSFWRLQKVDPGFNPKNALAVSVQLPQTKYKEENEQAAFFGHLIEKVATLPGVEAVGAGSVIPLSDNDFVLAFEIDGRPPLSPGTTQSTNYYSVSADYFKAMGIPLRRGRVLANTDTKDAPHVAVINETMARKMFPNEDPIGKRITFGSRDKPDWFEIVGIVGDVKHYGLDQETTMQTYEPYTQQTLPYMTLVVRTSGDPTSLSAAIRSDVLSLDKEQPVSSIKTLNDLFSTSIAQQQFSMLLLGVFAAVALALAAVGIYGVLSYAVTQRTHEIGIRMALGAGRRDVLWLVVGKGMLLTVIGVAGGLLAAFGLTRLMATLLFGVTATDAATFASVASALFVVALLACYIPALRATKVDPLVALRYE
jgi:putative ABC transport system permease protein